MSVFHLFILLFGHGLCFNVTRVANNRPAGVEEGGSVVLLCQADSWFEYCIWKHRDRICKFEWKRNSGSVEKQNCLGFADRINYVGDYNKHECKISISNVNKYDSGKWTCDLESYVLGDHTSGYRVERTVNVDVLSDQQEPTTATITTMTTTVTTTVTTTSDTRTSDVTTTSVTRTSDVTTTSVTEVTTDAATTGVTSVTPTLPANDDVTFPEHEAEARDYDNEHEFVTVTNVTSDANKTESDTEFPEFFNDDTEYNEAPTHSFPLVPVILAVTGGLFIVIVGVVYAVFRHNNKNKFSFGGDQEMQKESIKKLEMAKFVNESSESDLDDESAKKTVIYLGAKEVVTPN